ncbi:hypothetical protein E3N88_12337 [Mikania micrantha]|uniref:Uncharacterized protein n=1 Tax=Mikania micrantha TaxID=192012 RepID=A0A5N6P6I7_9ASTR|nr:hypothetical protein E3N88_12337 [Mikania micrantha]
MGKKRYDLNDTDKPPNHVPIDCHRHHHHHHHRHHNHLKPKKIRPEAKLLRTLNSHFKKLAKCHSRKVISCSSPRANDSFEDNKHHHDHVSCRLKLDYKDDFGEWFMSADLDHDDRDGDYMGEFGFGQELCLETMSFLGLENNEDLFGGDGVFDPDLGSSHSMVVVFDEDGSGSRSWSYIPDPVMNLGNGDEGKYLYDMLELSSQEDMISEFLRVNLFVS